MNAHPLSSNLVRPGCKVMKLDAEKGKPPKFPFLQKKKADRHNTLEHLRRVGRVSMVQIGDDEFRTPTRAERRAAGIRHNTQRNVLTLIAAKRGVAGLRKPVTVAASAPLAPRTYTRKQKLLRKAIVERNAWIEGMYEQSKLCLLVWRARGRVGQYPFNISYFQPDTGMEVPF